MQLIFPMWKKTQKQQRNMYTYNISISPHTQPTGCCVYQNQLIKHCKFVVRCMVSSHGSSVLKIVVRCMVSSHGSSVLKFVVRCTVSSHGYSVLKLQLYLHFSDTSLHGKPERIGTLILIFTKAESFRLALQKNVDPIFHLLSLPTIIPSQLFVLRRIISPNTKLLILLSSLQHNQQ